MSANGAPGPICYFLTAAENSSHSSCVCVCVSVLSGSNPAALTPNSKEVHPVTLVTPRSPDVMRAGGCLVPVTENFDSSRRQSQDQHTGTEL